LTRAEYLVGVQTQNEDFVYDKLGNRTTLKHNGTDVAKYTYDALGRRIEKIEYASPSNITTRYYYDGWRVLTEIEDDGQDTTQRDFACGNYLDEALIMTVDDDDYYYAHDHLFSPVAMVDSSGDIQEYYQYDAYGKCTIYTAGTDDIWYNSDDAPQTTSTVGNPIFFTGQRLDELDGGNLLIMYYKNRYYLVAIGRFITRDPLGVRDGICIIEFTPTGVPRFPRPNNAKKQYRDGMSLYKYVRSNPIANLDVFGLNTYILYGNPNLLHDDICSDPSRAKIHKRIWALLWQQKETWRRDFKDEGGNPYKHCVWNCKMTLRKGEKYAKDMSALKEQLDEALADLADTYDCDCCWPQLSLRYRRLLADWACSAHQSSDYRDNAKGRYCGSLNLVAISCEECCGLKTPGEDGMIEGITPTTGEGGKKRPYGPRCKPCYLKLMLNKEHPGIRPQSEW